MLTIKPYYKKYKNLKNKNKRYRRRITKLEENQRKVAEIIKKSKLHYLTRIKICELLGETDDKK